MSEAYENLAFSEEEAHLERIEGTVDEMIEEEKKKCASVQEELRGFRAYDYDDIENRRDMNEWLDRHLAQLSEYQGYKPSPYFAHIEFIRTAVKMFLVL